MEISIKDHDGRNCKWLGKFSLRRTFLLSPRYALHPLPLYTCFGGSGGCSFLVNKNIQKPLQLVILWEGGGFGVEKEAVTHGKSQIFMSRDFYWLSSKDFSLFHFSPSSCVWGNYICIFFLFFFSICVRDSMRVSWQIMWQNLSLKHFSPREDEARWIFGWKIEKDVRMTNLQFAHAKDTFSCHFPKHYNSLVVLTLLVWGIWRQKIKKIIALKYFRLNSSFIFILFTATFLFKPIGHSCDDLTKNLLFFTFFFIFFSLIKLIVFEDWT